MNSRLLHSACWSASILLVTIFLFYMTGVAYWYVPILGGCAWVISYLYLSRKNAILLFQQNAIPMLLIDVTTLRLLEANDAFFEKYGHTAVELKKLSLADLKTPEDMARLGPASGTQKHDESGYWEHRTRDGRKLYVNVKGQHIRYRGRPAKLASIIDASELQAYQGQVSAGTSLTESILDSSADLIWAVDRQFRYVTFNKAYADAAYEATGCRPAKLAPVAVRDKANGERWEHYYRQGLEGQTLQVFEETTIDSLGVTFGEVVISPVKADGAIIAVSCVSRDVTREYRYRLELRHALDTYESVSKATNEAIYDWNALTGEMTWKGNVLQFVSHPPAISTYNSWIEEVHPEDQERVLSALNNAIQQRRSLWSYEYRLRSGPSAYREVSSRNYAQYGPDGRLRRIVGTLRDLTEEREFQERVRLLSMVAAKVSNAVVIMDTEGLVEWVNEGFFQLSGYTLAEVKGNSLRNILCGADTDWNTVERIKRLLAEKISFTEQLLNYRKDGSTYWIKLNVTPVFDEKGQLEMYIIIHDDITNEKKMIRQLVEQNEQLRQIAWINSHELRNPVATLLSLLELARLDKSEWETCLQHIQTTVTNLDTIIHRIADIHTRIRQEE